MRAGGETCIALYSSGEHCKPFPLLHLLVLTVKYPRSMLDCGSHETMESQSTRCEYMDKSCPGLGICAVSEQHCNQMFSIRSLWRKVGYDRCSMEIDRYFWKASRNAAASEMLVAVNYIDGLNTNRKIFVGPRTRTAGNSTALVISQFPIRKSTKPSYSPT